MNDRKNTLLIISYNWSSSFKSCKNELLTFSANTCIQYVKSTFSFIRVVTIHCSQVPTIEVMLKNVLCRFTISERTRYSSDITCYVRKFQNLILITFPRIVKINVMEWRTASITSIATRLQENINFHKVRIIRGARPILKSGWTSNLWV